MKGTKNKESRNDSHLDEELYSRQLYVMGHDAMRKLMSAKVLIIGLDGLGQEIAKNVCLAGTKHVGLFDKSTVRLCDLSAGFYFLKKDIGKPKDEAVHPHLARLNRHVNVEVVGTAEVTCWDVIVSANQTAGDNLGLSELTHKNGIKLIIANVSGLFSQMFVDFVLHSCIDKNGQPLCSGGINDITPEGILTVADGSKHTLEDGDKIKIRNQIYEVKVLGKTELRLKEYVASEICVGGDYEQVREAIQMEFKELKEALKDEATIVSCGDQAREQAMHKIWKREYEREEAESDQSKLKTGSNEADTEQSKLKADQHVSNTDKENKATEQACVDSKLDSKLECEFKRTRGCVITPMCSILGGFAAQEVIKGITGKFIPLKQFLYFDEAEWFDVPEGKQGLTQSRYEHLAQIFGAEQLERLHKLNVFLVGAGAIGCENLKNFVMCGIGSKGGLFVTDMDSIEQSNLNRQFLFHEEDVGHLKSEAALQQSCLLNEDFKSGVGVLKSFNTPVGATTEDVFSDEFLSGIDIVANALDNVDARNYMDVRCVALRKPMVDAGTLGTKGHVQVVIPFRTECYRSTTDAVETSVPMCTIKSFPSTIEHAIEWALEIFRRKFNEEPEIISDFMSGKVEAEQRDEKGKEKDEEMEEFQDPLDSEGDSPKNLFDEAPRTIEGCIKSALDLFVQLFSTSIQRLLSTFPADYVTKEGFPFWAPPKRPPSPVSFNINDKIHILFVESCSNLFARAFNIRKIKRDEVFQYLENLLSLREPNPIKFDDKPVDLSVINPLEFEKDSWHADFIYACSNLRARNYKIKEQSKHFIRGIAGKIIPAIATTTAVVSGLATLELIKCCIASGRSNLASRNAFLDLAMPFLALVECVEPTKMEYSVQGERREYTLWSRMEFPDQPLRELIAQINKRLGESVSMVSIGSKMIYWDFCKKYEDNLAKHISELCQRKPGQLLQYIDVLTEGEMEVEDVVVLFE